MGFAKLKLNLSHSHWIVIAIYSQSIDCRRFRGLNHVYHNTGTGIQTKFSQTSARFGNSFLSFLRIDNRRCYFFFAQVIDIKIRYSYSSLFPSDNGIDNDTAYPFISIEQTIRVENA